jgi:hypothetical protein
MLNDMATLRTKLKEVIENTDKSNSDNIITPEVRINATNTIISRRINDITATSSIKIQLVSGGELSFYFSKIIGRWGG